MSSVLPSNAERILNLPPVRKMVLASRPSGLSSNWIVPVRTSPDESFDQPISWIEKALISSLGWLKNSSTLQSSAGWPICPYMVRPRKSGLIANGTKRLIWSNLGWSKSVSSSLRKETLIFIIHLQTSINRGPQEANTGSKVIDVDQ